MFFHFVTRKISLICKISAFFEDLSFLKPRNHLKIIFKKIPIAEESIFIKSCLEVFEGYKEEYF